MQIPAEPSKDARILIDNFSLQKLMTNDKTHTHEDLNDVGFEQAYQELEAIVERMERGDQNLENSLADFERGVALMKRCHGVLKNAEQQVEILVKDNEGLFNTEAFEDKSL